MQMHEFACACGADPTHVIFTRVDNIQIKPDEFGVHVRGWCDDCSPAVDREYLAEVRRRQAAATVDAPIQPWWRRLLRTA